MKIEAADQIEAVYPLSAVQRGMLFHTLDPTSDRMYFFQIVFSISNGIDLERFRRAWQMVIDRHQMLRTGFVWKGLDQPVQFVLRQADLPLVCEQGAPADAEAFDTYLAEFLRSDRHRGLSLTRPPLMRLSVINAPNESYTVVWSLHHLIMDAWSQSLLLGELLEFYDMLKEGTIVSKHAPATFGSYIRWLEQRSLSKDEGFWRGFLAGVANPSMLRIQHKRQRGEQAITVKEQVALVMAESDSVRLWERCRTLRVTLNTLVQAAWGILVSKYSGMEDVVYGVTVANRPAELRRAESIIGPMINTVPCRLRLRAEESVGSLLQRVQMVNVELLEYSATPIGEILQWLKWPNEKSLLETIIVFENARRDAAVAERVQAECRDCGSIEPINYPLALKVCPGDKPSFKLVYDAAKFDHDLCTSMLIQLQSVIEQLSGDSQRPVGAIALVRDEADARATTTIPHLENADATADSLFCRAAQEYKELVAVVTPLEQVTYSELDRRVTRLANLLTSYEAGPEKLVGVYLPRGLEQIVAALAVWRSGAVYVPLDTRLQDDALSLQLGPLHPTAILCCSRDAVRLKAAAQHAHVIEITRTQRSPNTCDQPVFPVVTSSGAYVIFTSGSTGSPKGVVVSHAGLRDLVAAQASLLAPGPGARVLQFASPTFDASIFEMTLALCSGGTLVQQSETDFSLGKSLLDFMIQARVTHAVLPPSLLAALPDCEVPMLHTIIVAGETVSSEVVRRWSKGRKFFNAYGPTEGTIWSTLAQLDSQSSITIGKPVSGTEAYITDLHGQRSPLQVVGEIQLGGSGLARGYFNDAAMTATRFVPDHISGALGARLYRTGDLGCWTKDGNIELHGRQDHQAKVRGYRIELEGIEHALLEHPSISAAAAVTVAGESVNSLVTFVVLSPGASLDPPALRSWLLMKLPEYCVPARTIVTSELPLTRAGKVDRGELAQRAQRAAVTNQEVPLDMTPLERRVAQLWREVTGVAAVDLSGNLFDQGGDSLRLMDFIGRVSVELDVEVPIAVIFESPTLSFVAEYILQHSGVPARSAY